MKAKSIFFASALVLTGCTGSRQTDFSQQLVSPLNDEQVILEYRGGKITAKDVKAKLKPQFERIREQLLNSYIKAAEDLLQERLADQNKAEVEEVSEQELDNYLKANKLAKVDSEKIRIFLAAEKSRIKKQIGKMQIFKDMDVQNKLGAARYDIQATADMPTQGVNSADVTIQVFCDFANPTCNRSRLLMGELKNQFGSKIRWIFRHFPVPSNPIGQEASLAAICAQLQNVFWPVHDRFFDNQAQLSKENLIKLSTDAGADEGKMSACLQSEEPKNLLDKELKSAEALGLTQTPAYFVNGTKINDIDQLKPFITSQLGKK